MTLCSVGNDILFRDIERVIRSLNITHLSLTPTVAALINSQNVPNVKFIVTAGEALTLNVLKNWANKGLWQGDFTPIQRDYIDRLLIICYIIRIRP